MDYRKSKLEKRYLEDSAFCQCVNAMEKMIAEHGITPSELREALFLAHYKYEMENPSAIKNSILIRMGEMYSR